MDEEYGEGGGKEVPGEGGPFITDQQSIIKAEVIVEKRLTYDEASKCLNTLGKDESGCRYAYLRLTASNMKLTDVAIVLKFKHVLFLDLSANYLTSKALQPLTDMPYLIMLKVDRNRIDSMALKSMPYLQVLNFSENQISKICELNQPLLDCLELNHNNIYITDFIACKLQSLRQMELRNNLLFEISGEYPPTLEKLFLPANKINNIHEASLSALTNLKLLHLRDNMLEKLDGFTSDLKHLKYLNLRNNVIRQMKEFLKLQCLPALETLIVIGNPIVGFEQQVAAGEGGGDRPVMAGEGAEDAMDGLVIALLAIMPNLKRVNKVTITALHRIKANDLDNELLNEIFYGQGNDASDLEEPTTTDLTSEYKTESESERGLESDVQNE